MNRHLIRIIFAILFCVQLSVAIKAQPHGHPSFIGFDVGTGLTVWQNATPTYFPTVYPYTAIPDTIHVPFNSGATPLFGFFLAVSGDFHLDPQWSILAKFGYAEKRGNWKSTESTEFDTNGTTGFVPVTSEFTFMLRTVFLEGYASYHFGDVYSPYAGLGISVVGLANNHYDLSQSIEGGPSNISFRNLSSRQSTGNRSYSIGGEEPAASALAELKIMAGYPIHLIGRWIMAPEIEFGYPLTNIWTSERLSEYQAAGVNAPQPITLTGSIAFRYRYNMK
jgi:hypothetical protein